MRKRFTCVGLFALAALPVALYFSTAVGATPPNDKFSGSTIAKGRLGPVDVFNHVNPPSTPADQQGREQWISMQKLKRSSDLYIQSNVWQPGGTTGWHTHPGHSLITVTEGELTAYEMENGGCTPHVYTAGTTFVDEGGDHAHVIRNEGAVLAKTVVVQVIPAAAPRRIDVPVDQVPTSCPL